MFDAAVLGAGSWGTALSILLARNGLSVQLLGRDEEEIASLQALRENLRYLPGFALPDGIDVAHFESMTQADIWVVAVPSDGVREVVRMLPHRECVLVLAAKGLEPGSARVLSEVVLEEKPEASVCAISGPNLAVELAQGIPTAAVCASASEAVATRVASSMNCRTLRVYLSNDLLGLQIAGALKNVLAIAAGMSDGLGFGDNTKGVLLARGLREMVNIGVRMGAQPDTFFGIAGVGDLFATANSRLSRNYRVGYGLGKGKSLSEVLEEIGQVAEGVSTAQSVSHLARSHDVHLPIFDLTRRVLFEGLRPLEGVSMLMDNPPKREEILLS